MSVIKLACMTLPYNAFSFERSLQGIAGAGYRYIVFGLPHEGKEVLESCNEAGAELIIRQLERYGLKASSLVGTSWLAPGQPIERAAQLFAFAKIVGASEVISLGTWGYRQFPNEPLEAGEREAADEKFAAHFRLVAAEAKRAGITVTLKPHTGNTATAAILKGTLAAIGSSAVKASYDPGNVQFYEGIDAAEDFAIIADLTVSLRCQTLNESQAGDRTSSPSPEPNAA